jgi:site-specific DNA recombinase
MAKKSVRAAQLPTTQKAVLYARVSSKEQDKEGFSIPAQQKLLTEYAQQNKLVIEQEFIDVETAKLAGRANFGEMVRYLKTHPQISIVLVEKTDRLYRNFKDYICLDELDIQIHLVKEGVVLSSDSKSSEKFVHGIKVLMAKNYIDNLSEEARKGQLEKAEQGFWPSKAPLGYRNVAGPDGKRIIALDPEISGIVRHIFGWYATGTLSLKEVSEKARAAGLTYRRTGAAVPVSAVHTMLRCLTYTGEFLWNGRVYKGRHEPLVSHELWERVQGVLDGRNARKIRKSKFEFAFQGLISCGHCGCAMVGELKKGQYVYYHCTGYKGKCGEPYVRQEALEERFQEALAQLEFGDKVLEWVTKALRESHVDEKKEHDAAIARLQAEYDRLQGRVHAIYVDKLDGRIDNHFFDKLSGDWRKEQDRCLREISLHQTADQSYLEEGAQLLELAQGAAGLFQKQNAHEKRRLLNFVLSNCTWKGGELQTTFRQPFDLLAQTTAIIGSSAGRKGLNSAAHPGWLGN